MRSGYSTSSGITRAVTSWHDIGTTNPLSVMFSLDQWYTMEPLIMDTSMFALSLL